MNNTQNQLIDTVSCTPKHALTLAIRYHHLGSHENRDAILDLFDRCIDGQSSGKPPSEIFRLSVDSATHYSASPETFTAFSESILSRVDRDIWVSQASPAVGSAIAIPKRS